MTRRNATEAERFWRSFERDAATGCWVWQRRRSEWGYGRFTLRGRSVRAHRYAYELLVEPIPDGLFVLHHCDNPPCVNPAHLFLGTDADNVADREAKGRHRHERITSTLTIEQVREIRDLYKRGRVQQALAAQFGVGQTQIGRIVRGEHWKEPALSGLPKGPRA